jgi:hypothetical protein
MKLSSVRLSIFACCLGALTVVAACGSKSKAAIPTAPTPVVVTPKLETPSAKTPVANQQLDTLKPTLTVNNAAATGSVGTVTYEFQVSELNSFPDGSRTSTSADAVPQGSDGTTSWVPPSNLIPVFTYYWHARAKNGTLTTDWSPTETFRTQSTGFRNGQNIFDPLTEGVTVASRRIGGHFVGGVNGGWQSDGLDNALDYDIPTCASCKVEFDVTNFGNGEGTSISVDVKWFSMGDAGLWGDFQSFRDQPWKMHLEQRSDGDGSGMQLIWRNGANDNDTGGDPEYGDHRGKYLFGGPNWGHSFDNKVWHFVIEWTRTTYKVSLGEIGGSLVTWFPGAGSSGFFGGNHPYAPPNHRIELGCSPRGESMIGARYRNFRVTPQ